MFVLGTAGHVDHGKSTLVRAMTGIDPDRLREEKERGMTIDLGFAWLTLPSGRDVSIVDVPGHERFIKNMLAGVGGIDLALLIVAADEGVMPQTREHLAILDLLGVTSGIAVVTKQDLVEPDWLELVVADVEELLAPTSLADSRVVAVSATTGQGIPSLLDAIDEKLSHLESRRDLGRPRLPIDRVFTIAGFGTVVTGTLIDGSLGVGQEITVLPSGQRSRIRGLQTHRQKVERAEPGSRVAANLVGLATTDLKRGDVLTAPGWLAPTQALDVRLRVLESLDRPLPHNAPVTLFTGSNEVAAKVRLLDQPELLPGETGWAQIRTDEPIAVVKGDPFVIRSSSWTLGGGRIVEIRAKRHRRFHDATLSRLSALERGSPAEILLETLVAREPIDVATLVRTAPIAEVDARDGLRELIEREQVRVLANRPADGASLLISNTGWTRIRNQAEQTLAAFHRQFPLRLGMAKEELKNRLGFTPRIFADALIDLVGTGLVVETAALVRLLGHDPRPDSRGAAAVQRYLDGLRETPYSPPSDQPIDPELLHWLIDTEQIVRVNDQVVFEISAYRTMVDQVVEHVRGHGKVTVAEVRDMFGTSRKYALGLLEHLDEIRVTRRVGDDRVLRAG